MAVAVVDGDYSKIDGDINGDSASIKSRSVAGVESDDVASVNSHGRGRN